MHAQGLTPILNVSDIQQSFAWFEKLGWKKGWDWGEPPTFGGVCSGKCEIFLSLDGQGGRGKGDQSTTFGSNASESADHGVWMSIWVEDVDAIYRRCLDEGIEVTWKPTDMPWNVREMHIRHPDGHVFRVSQGIEAGAGDAAEAESSEPALYVNTYVIGVPEERKDEYARIASVFAEVARDFGALEIFENWELEVPDGEQTDYRKAVKAEPGEKIVLSWVVWPDRETGARAHKGMFADPRMLELGKMPFDGKRMILGGFEPIVTYRKS